MKRYREIVFSLTEPTDKEVIWIYPVKRPEENDLKVETIQVEEENFDTIYQVKIWGNDGWENILRGSLEYIRSQMEFKIEKVEQYCDTLDDNIGDIADKMGEVPEGTTVMGAINNITGGSDISLNTLNTQLGELTTVVNGHTTAIAGKVDVDGDKQLSDENFTTALKNKLAAIPISGFMTFKGIKASTTDLPLTGNTEGDVYLIGSESPYDSYIWDGTNWIEMGEVADFSDLYSKSEVDDIVEELEDSIDDVKTVFIRDMDSAHFKGGNYYPLFNEFLVQDGDTVNTVTDPELRLMSWNINFDEYQSDYAYARLYLGGFGSAVRDGYTVTKYLNGELALYSSPAQHSQILSPSAYAAEGDKYYLPSISTDGGDYTLATRAVAEPSLNGIGGYNGLMSATDKEKLDNINTTIENAVSAEIATQIQSVEGVVPIGGIIMWSGQESAIDTSKWALCNGQTVNGHITPDLRGKFIMSSTYGETVTFTPVTPTGDNESETIKANTNAKTKVDPILVNGINKYGYFQHKITANEISHTHKIETDSYKVRRTQDTLEVIKDTDPEVSIYNMTNTSKVSFVPPYYVLAFIMRIA